MRVGCLIRVLFAKQAKVYVANTKRECALDISFRSQSRIKLECIVPILSVSALYMSHSGLNRESSLSELHEY